MDFRLWAASVLNVPALESITGIEKGAVAKQLPEKSRGNHTKKCWLPRLFALELSCETNSKALRA